MASNANYAMDTNKHSGIPILKINFGKKIL